jgi:hypothetical protein
MLGDEKTARQEGRRHTAKGQKSPLKSASTTDTGNGCAFGLIDIHRKVIRLHPVNRTGSTGRFVRIHPGSIPRLPQIIQLFTKQLQL